MPVEIRHVDLDLPAPQAASASRASEPVPAASCDALLALATRAADEAAYERVSQLFRAAKAAGIAPADLPRWQRLLVEAGDCAAATLAEQGSAPRGDETSVAAAPDLETGSVAPGEAGDDLLDFEPGPRTADEPAATSPIVAALLQRFAGRGDVYARQWYDARRDQSGYWPVREPLTERVLELHVLGRITVGQYVLHPDNTVSFAAVDLDPTAAALEHMRLADDAEGGLACSALVEYARRISAAATRAGVPVFAEETGGVGLHLWMFFAPRLAAERARAVLRELLCRAGAQPPAVSVEIFPKQDRLAGKGLGNLIKLPLGVHQATLRPSRLLGLDLNPLPAADALARIRASEPSAIEALLAARVTVLPVPARDPGVPSPTRRPLPPPAVPHDPSPRALAEALAAVAPVRVAEQAADRMLAGCAVLRDLARRAHEERRLSADAARALLYTVGLVGRENDRIEAMFGNAGVSRKELDRVRLGLQGPMGCKKLGERFPSRCDGCHCPAAPAGGYATPALFALAQPPRFERRRELCPDASDLAADPGDVSQAELQERLARIEATLQRLAGQMEDGSVALAVRSTAPHLNGETDG